MVIKGFKLWVVKIGSVDHLYNMVTVVNNILYLKVAKHVDLKCIYHQKMVIMSGDGCVN